MADYSQYIAVKKVRTAQTANANTSIVKGRAPNVYDGYFPLYKGISLPINALLSNKFTSRLGGDLSAPPAFSPLDISGTLLWLDAADSTTLVLSGSIVTQWKDKSGTATNATTAAGPALSTYNTYPVLSFNGSSQYFVTTNTISRSTHTLIAVHRPANSTGNRSLFRYQDVNYTILPAGARGYITNADGSLLDSNNSPLNDNSVTTSLNLMMAVIATGSQAIFKNGVQQASTAEALVSGVSDPLTIGRYNPVPSDYYQGDLGEMIIYNKNLTTTERQQVEGYLAWKWGLQSSLPVGHPYKLAKP